MLESVLRVVGIRTYLTPNFGWVQLEPMQGKVDPRRFASSQNMADNNLPQIRRRRRQTLSVCYPTAGVISHGPAPTCRNTAGGGDGNCLLWDGHIIDATFPLV